MANGAITSLRARYGQEAANAQQEGLDFPPFEEWVKTQQAQPESNTLASLMQRRNKNS